MSELLGKQWELIKLRKKNDVTQSKLANVLGINLRTYVTKETGQSEFKQSELVTICKYFNASMDDIFFTP